jgi:hypothetical protein
VGYKNFGGINSQYGLFAKDVASKLGVAEERLGFWLFVLVDWADEQPTANTAFVLRPQVVSALKRLGPPWQSAA